MFSPGRTNGTYVFVNTDGVPLGVGMVMDPVTVETLADAQAAATREANTVRSLQAQYQNAQIRITCKKQEKQIVKGGPVGTGGNYGRMGVEFGYLRRLRTPQHRRTDLVRPGVPGIGQNSAESFLSPSSWTTYFVAEVHLTKDDFSFVPVSPGGYARKNRSIRTSTCSAK